MYSAYPSPCVHAQVQAVSAQGVGNYSDPASVTVESFPAAYTVAIVAVVVSLAITVASVILLVCLIWQCCTIRRCVCVYICMGGCGVGCMTNCVLNSHCMYIKVCMYSIHAIVEH